MAHSSVYVQETGLVYVYGGEYWNRVEISQVFAYNPFTYHWREVSAGPVHQAFHSTVLMGGALVSFGGYIDLNNICFSSRLIAYDIRE